MNKPSTSFYAAVSIVIALAMVVNQVQAQSSQDASWQKQTESSLKAIYERGEFRPQKFQADWLADSSGYAVQELDPKTDKMLRITYSVRNGERSEAKPDEGKRTEKGALMSPDGKRVLEFQGQNLFVRELESGNKTQLTSRLADRDVRFYDPVWSPNGGRVAFVESDSTNVRKRAVLVPDDPSYPGVKNNRVARVGEKLRRFPLLWWIPMARTYSGYQSIHRTKASIWGR